MGGAAIPRGNPPAAPNPCGLGVPGSTRAGVGHRIAVPAVAGEQLSAGPAEGGLRGDLDNRSTAGLTRDVISLDLLGTTPDAGKADEMGTSDY